MKEKIGLPKLKESTRTALILDPSSQHLAYVIVQLEPASKTCSIASCGMIWAADKWSKGERFLYMDRCFKTILEGRGHYIPEEVITEQYFMNPKLRSGVAVIPVINGLLEKNCSELGDLPYHEVPPPTWRSKLGIKAIKDSKGKRDYKTPTKNLVEDYVGKLPDEVKSNITNKPRALPHDLSDALAITLAVCLDNGYEKFEVMNACYYNFTLMDALNKLAKELGNETI